MSLLKPGLPLIKNLLTSLVKSVLVSFGLTEAAANPVIHKKILGSGTTALIISNEEINDIMKLLSLLKTLVYW